MSDSYNKFKHNTSINSCNGSIYKTYKESWFIQFHLNSELAYVLFNQDSKYRIDNSTYKKYSGLIILQMVICGEMQVIAEVMYKEDFDKYFDDLKEEE